MEVESLDEKDIMALRSRLAQYGFASFYAKMAAK